ncbi:hypothetical protein BWQ96_08804 [Gracilariopsis chorda]|uniref:Uncharacterized protein n=1 Tax=Gracilariopsis chorda TaxID=448386 RepID=A0A2V3IHB9_9FLOR|nr:hypothetical protein BWQ96_08804 [Gracilariopsis chorda]|eukprot:PXF41469.1 hypothetical protein BWQ96_08804 [Gracilariopsis chorda]
MASRTQNQRIIADNAFHGHSQSSALDQIPNGARDVPTVLQCSSASRNTSRLQNLCGSSDSDTLPPSSVMIPAVAFKKEIKAFVSAGDAIGAAVTARTLFNCMYQKLMGRTFETMEADFPLYTEMANCVKDDVRVFVYQRLNITRGSRTYSSVKCKYAKHLSHLKDRLLENYPVLKAAQRGWVMDAFIREAIQRDNKAVSEAEKRKEKMKKSGDRSVSVDPCHSWKTLNRDEEEKDANEQGTKVTSTSTPKYTEEILETQPYAAAGQCALIGGVGSFEMSENAAEDPTNEEEAIDSHVTQIKGSSRVSNCSGKVRQLPPSNAQNNVRVGRKRHAPIGRKQPRALLRHKVLPPKEGTSLLCQPEHMDGFSASPKDSDLSDENDCSPVIRDALKALSSKETTASVRKRSSRSKRVAKMLRK